MYLEWYNEGAKRQVLKPDTHLVTGTLKSAPVSKVLFLPLWHNFSVNDNEAPN